MADWQMTHSVLRFVEFETKAGDVWVQPMHVEGIETVITNPGEYGERTCLVMASGKEYRVFGGHAEVLRRLLGVDT